MGNIKTIVDKTTFSFRNIPKEGHYNRSKILDYYLELRKIEEDIFE